MKLLKNAADVGRDMEPDMVPANEGSAGICVFVLVLYRRTDTVDDGLTSFSN